MSRIHPGLGPSFTRGRISWTGELQPSALAETYTVKIEYALQRRPKIRVLKPALRRLASGEKIPHTFSDGSICLHLHLDWTPGMYIADTIVPWLALWLLHYESWKATGTWLGGGHEPDTNE